MPLLNSVTLTRSRRPNAGSRMSRLLNEEEEDDFYQSAYGGFAEVSIAVKKVEVSLFMSSY